MRSSRVIISTALGGLLLATSLIGLSIGQGGGSMRTAEVDGTPVRVYATQDHAPTIVIAHGFAGSAQIMDPLARSLMRRGFTVVSFDTLGHGANPVPLPMDGSTRNRSSSTGLQQAMATVLNWAVAQPEVDPDRLALLGHSMGAGAVVEYAVRDAAEGGRIRATVALSLPSAEQIPVGTSSSPANLLLAVGALEPAGFQAAALEAMQAAYPQAQLGQRLGDATQGTARSAIQIPGAEHIGIVFSSAAADAAATWIGGVLGFDPGSGEVAPVVAWFVLSLIGMGLLLVPIGRLVLGFEPGAVTGIRGWKVLVTALAAASIASIVARLTSPWHDLIPVAVGGYVATWFLAAGAVTLTWWALRWRSSGWPTITRRAAGAAALLAATVVIVIAITGRLSWAPFALVGVRPVVLLVLLAAFLAYFGSDALLVRNRGFIARLGLICASRVIAIIVILASVPLLQAPGFLILLLPLMVILLLVLGWYASIILGYRNGWLAATLVQGAALAALVATTFPLLTSP